MNTIALPSVITTDANAVNERKYVSFNQSAYFKLDKLAIFLITQGVIAFSADLEKKIKESNEYDRPKTVTVGDFLLAQKFGAPINMELENDIRYEGVLSRAEVVSIKNGVLAAMAKQEALRDFDNQMEAEGPKTKEVDGEIVPDVYEPQFDADLYIQMKHLLLDVSLWLCGSVID